MTNKLVGVLLRTVTLSGEEGAADECMIYIIYSLFIIHYYSSASCDLHTRTMKIVYIHILWHIYIHNIPHCHGNHRKYTT